MTGPNLHTADTVRYLPKLRRDVSPRPLSWMFHCGYIQFSRSEPVTLRDFRIYLEDIRTSYFPVARRTGVHRAYEFLEQVTTIDQFPSCDHPSRMFCRYERNHSICGDDYASFVVDLHILYPGLGSLQLQGSGMNRYPRLVLLASCIQRQFIVRDNTP